MNEEDEIEAVAKRRKIRQQQRQLKVDMDSVKDQLTDVKSEKFQTALGALDNIFTTVSHPREQQYDAMAFKELSFAVKAQSANMADLSHRFDFGSFAAKVQSKYSRDGNFSWTDFGLDVGHIITGVPLFETMLGPMKKEIKPRKVAVRRERERNVAENEKPEEVEQDASESNEETNSRLKSLHKVIMQEENDQVEPFDLLKLLIDPEDNVQTIENFFDFSFLVKNKLVVQDIDEDTGLPIAMGVDPNKLSQAESNDKSQMILAINMRDLQEFAKILYPDAEASSSGKRPSTSSSNGSSSSSSSTRDRGGGRLSAASSGSSSVGSVNPLHRDDELYHTRNVKEQVALLRSRKENESKQRKAASAAASSRAVSATNGLSRKQQQQTQQSSSAGPTKNGRLTNGTSSIGSGSKGEGGSGVTTTGRNSSSSTLDTTTSAAVMPLTAKALSVSNSINTDGGTPKSVLHKRSAPDASAARNKSSPMTVNSAQENITPEGQLRR